MFIEGLGFGALLMYLVDCINELKVITVLYSRVLEFFIAFSCKSRCMSQKWVILVLDPVTHSEGGA